ncbi:hypothetical protein FMEAI12_5360016 [Parafrankia sp. Ea1.12]|nr:hypothetical protein FMEAI12_5360016 [Parafrankia sp. Ea1.12]
MDALTDVQRDRLDALTAACPEMTSLANLVRGFAAFLDPADSNNDRLTAWITTARAADLPHLRAYTRGLDLDRDAVNNALTLPYSNGGTEGVNAKTKKILSRCTAESTSHSSATGSCSANTPSPPNMRQSRYSYSPTVTTESGTEPLTGQSPARDSGARGGREARPGRAAGGGEAGTGCARPTPPLSAATED